MPSTYISNRVARNFGGSWLHRRRIIYGTLIFCAFCILYLMCMGDSASRLQETIANAAFFLAGGVIGSYVFGAVWDDKGPTSAIQSGSLPASQDQANGGELVGGTDNVDDPDKQ